MQEKVYKKHLIVWIVVTVVLMGGSFYAGMKHSQSTSPFGQNRGQFAAGGTRGGGAAAAGRFGAGGGLVMGSVLTKDDTSMTVKMRDGSSKIVLYSGTTQVMKSTAGAASDVAVGSQVSVQGTQNSDGSVTAQSIQIRPEMTGGTTGGSPTGAAGGNSQN